MNTSRQVTVVMYHYVRELAESRYPGIKGLNLSAFRQQLEFFKQNYHVISCQRVFQALETGDGLPEKSMILTFDDGYIDHYTNVFPLLKRYDMTGFFSMPGKILAEGKLLDVNKIHFILASTPMEKLLPMVYERLDYYRGAEYEMPETGALHAKLAVASRFDPAEVVFVKRLLQVELEESLRYRIVDDLFAACVGIEEAAFAKEQYMSLDQVWLMKQSGMEWGIHGYDHYWLNRLSPDKMRRDLEKALDVFDGVVPRKGWICCYPYGSLDDEVIRTARELGAGGGFSTKVAVADLDGDSIYALPRLDTNDFPPKSENYLHI